MKIMQLIDSLAPGGAERMAVSLANGLAASIGGSFLCTTRSEGLLRNQLALDVNYLYLKRKSTFDIGAFKRLLNYVEEHGISVIHAHGSSFFLATLIKVRNPSLKFVWHDHYGNRDKAGRIHNTALKMCSRYFDTVITVNSNLQQWAKANLLCKNVVSIKNFIGHSNVHQEAIAKLSYGVPEKRVVCVANLRPDKDHDTLLAAFQKVQQKYEEWSLLLVGKNSNDIYGKRILKQLTRPSCQNITFLGERSDIMNVLTQCQIGVLSSRSEGLPMALLEYGIAGLPVVCTTVGDCETVVGNAGFLVKPESPSSMADRMIELISDEEMRISMGKKFKDKIESTYTFEAILPDLMSCYGAK